MLRLNLGCCSQSQTISLNPKSYLHHSLSSKHSLNKLPLTLPNTALFLSKPTTTTTANAAVSCRQSEYSSSTTSSSSRPHFSSNDASFSPGAKVFVGYSVYKGKAALTVEPRAPEFAPLDVGNFFLFGKMLTRALKNGKVYTFQCTRIMRNSCRCIGETSTPYALSGAFKIAKEGFVLLQFAPAAGVRQYDWSRKQVFSLSVAEIGSLVSLGTRDSCEFFHDPNKGKSDEGKVRKVLKVQPLPDGSGHFFNLSVQNKLLNVDESIYIPVTKAEFAVLVTAFNYILPYLLGWHSFANSIKPDENCRVNNANPRYGGDYEWTR